MSKIILTGGGTGGHVIPHIALLPQLEKLFDEIHYIGSKTGIEKEIISKYPQIKYHEITTVKLKRKLTLSNLLIPFKLIAGISESKKIIKKLQPDVIFSKGGFVAVPVVFGAKKVPVIGHESDFSLGLANKLILRKCKVMCCSFEATAQKIGKKGVFTGSPIQPSILQKQPPQYQFNNSKPCLLIMGGSTGAQRINECVVESLDELLKEYNVIHLTGKGKNNPSIKKANYVQIEYSNKMGALYQNCDVVISRAGSNTIFELLALNLPMLLIPLPKTESRGDQLENVQELLKKNLCSVLYQENLSKETLLKSLTNLKELSVTYKENIRTQNILAGADNIVKVIVENRDKN